MAIWGRELECKSCLMRLAPRGLLVIDFSIYLVCHVALVLVGAYSFFAGTWLILGAAILLYLCITALPDLFGGFKVVD